MRKLFLGVLAASLAVLSGLVGAATANYASAYNIETISVMVAGQRTATVTPWKQTLPYPAKLIGVTAYCRASGGTTPTLTIDIAEGGTSVLSSAISITADTIATGTISDSALADEATMTMVMTIGGTNPTWDDCSVLLTLLRK